MNFECRYQICQKMFLNNRDIDFQILMTTNRTILRSPCPQKVTPHMLFIIVVI